MNLKRKAAAALAGGALAAGLVVAGAAPGAFAIDRVSCANVEFLTLFSDNSTCWANAGSQSVTLNNVYQAWGGNNTGRVYESAIGTYYNFYAGSYSSVNNSYPVTTVQIY